MSFSFFVSVFVIIVIVIFLTVVVLILLFLLATDACLRLPVTATLLPSGLIGNGIADGIAARDRTARCVSMLYRN